ncbi:MAG: S41 family peptidase [Candidatus Spechtbacterales bacterium]|nr:S41 family peptidase [Candidatus Spechtbacterales bacterium]
MKPRLVVFMIITLLVSACSVLGGDNTSANGNNDNSFCPEVERQEIDFSVLNDVVIAINEYSVFTDTAQNSELLLDSSLDTLFNYLGVRSSGIPDWAHDIVDEEVERSGGAPNFSVLNRVVDRLQDDSQYSDLKDPSRLEDLLEVMIEGIIDGVGDPFANYIPAKQWLLMEAGERSFSGTFVGMGVTLSENNKGQISITSVMSATPAEESGLEIGDAIVAVNGMPTESCTRNEFSARLRTVQDPKLELLIEREKFGTQETETLEISLVREEIPQQFIHTYPGIELPNGRGSTSEGIPYRCGVSGGIGLDCPFEDEDGNIDTLYIKITAFNEQAVEDLRYFLLNIDQSQFTGVVLDLRDNGGGLVSAGRDIINMLMSTDGAIRVTKDANGVITRHRGSNVSILDQDLPMTILMNKDSYSMSEGSAAALRDNGRAIIVSRDKRTGGKGTTNRYLSLRGGEYGALYVSIGYFLTPDGEMIEKMDHDDDGYYEVGGLKPDIHVPWSNADYSENNQDVNYDPTLFAALEWIHEELSK